MLSNLTGGMGYKDGMRSEEAAWAWNVKGLRGLAREGNSKRLSVRLWERGRAGAQHQRDFISGNASLEQDLQGRFSRELLTFQAGKGQLSQGFRRDNHTHRHRKYEIRIPCKICDVSVERDPFLSCSRLAHSQGHTQDGIGPKLG